MAHPSRSNHIASARPTDSTTTNNDMSLHDALRILALSMNNNKQRTNNSHNNTPSRSNRNKSSNKQRLNDTSNELTELNLHQHTTHYNNQHTSHSHTSSSNATTSPNTYRTNLHANSSNMSTLTLNQRYESYHSVDNEEMKIAEYQELSQHSDTVESSKRKNWSNVPVIPSQQSTSYNNGGMIASTSTSSLINLLQQQSTAANSNDASTNNNNYYSNNNISSTTRRTNTTFNPNQLTIISPNNIHKSYSTTHLPLQPNTTNYRYSLHGSKHGDYSGSTTSLDSLQHKTQTPTRFTYA